MSHSRRFLVLLLGGSQFPRLGVQANPAFENSATALERYFRTQRDGPGTYVVESLFDSEDSVADQADQIRTLLRKHTDATDLLLYYVGHGGFLKNRGREYFLALRSTRRPGEDVTGLRAESLADIIKDNFADRRVFVLLDCCFAGEAVHEFQSDGLGKIAENGILRTGTALLVAASKDEPAISPIGRPYTMFCECLMEVLTTGIRGAPRHLSLEAVADQLKVVLVNRFALDAVLPEIHSPRQPQGSIAREPIFANPAYAGPALPPHLVSLLNNDLVQVRTIGVQALEVMLDEDEEAAVLARLTLEGIAANDDSKTVAALAVAALKRRGSSDDVPPHDPGLSAGEPPEIEGVLVEPARVHPRESAPDGPHPGGAEPVHTRPLLHDGRTGVPPSLDQAAAADLPIRGELVIDLQPSRARVEAGASVTWTCTVSNPLPIWIREITLTDERSGAALAAPFDLAPGAGTEVHFVRRYAERGSRLVVTAQGRSEGGARVSAQGKGRVTVTQSQQTTRIVPSAGQQHAKHAAEPRAALAADPPATATATAAPLFGFAERIEPRVLDLSRFRAGLRQVKVAADLADPDLNQLIQLLEEGERHYRIASGDLRQPRTWPDQVQAWMRTAAIARDEDVVMLKLDPPSRADISESIGWLASRIEGATRVHIPLDEFN